MGIKTLLEDAKRALKLLSSALSGKMYLPSKHVIELAKSLDEERTLKEKYGLTMQEDIMLSLDESFRALSVSVEELNKSFEKLAEELEVYLKSSLKTYSKYDTHYSKSNHIRDKPILIRVSTPKYQYGIRLESGRYNNRVKG